MEFVSSDYWRHRVDHLSFDRVVSPGCRLRGSRDRPGFVERIW